MSRSFHTRTMNTFVLFAVLLLTLIIGSSVSFAQTIRVPDIEIEDSYFRYESAEDILFKISSSEYVTEDIVFDISVEGSGAHPATPGVDFVWVDGTQITMPQGYKIVYVEIIPIDDTIIEEEETFTVTLSIASGSGNLTRASAIGTITDNDERPRLAIHDTTAIERDGVVSFLLTSHVEPYEDIVLEFSTESGTGEPAIEGVDFVSLDGTQITFPAGQRNITVDVELIPDNEIEFGERWFTVSFTIISGVATEYQPSARGYIIDLGPGKPSKPLLSSPVNNSNLSGTQSPTFVWAPNSAAEQINQYKLIIKNDATGKTAFNGTFASTDICTASCTVDLATLTPAVTLGKGTYNWVVTAINLSGNAKSKALRFALVKPAKPVAVTPTANVTLNTVNPTLTFTIPDQNITEAKVAVKDAQGKNVFTVTAPTGDICVALTCNVIVTAPLGGGSYSWTAQVFNVNGKSASKAAAFKIVFPDKPVNLAPTSNTNVPTFTPVLTWDEVVNAGEYRVTLTPANGKKTVIDWIASGANGFLCDAGVCTLDLAAVDSLPVLKKGNYTWVVEARNTALHPTSKTKSAKAKFKVV